MDPYCAVQSYNMRSARLSTRVMQTSQTWCIRDSMVGPSLIAPFAPVFAIIFAITVSCMENTTSTPLR